MGFPFPPAHRIRKRAEYVRLKERGLRLYTTPLVYVWQCVERGAARLGLVVSKRVGNAVVRNRIKRLIREAFRLYAGSLDHYEVVVTARAAAARAQWKDIAGTMQTWLRHVAGSRHAKSTETVQGTP